MSTPGPRQWGRASDHTHSHHTCVIPAYVGQESLEIPACSVVEGRYRYMQDLLALEATVTGKGPSPFIPASPLKTEAWQEALRHHPDQAFAAHILTGMRRGFHIGVDRGASLRSALCNLQSYHTHNHAAGPAAHAGGDAGRSPVGPPPPPIGSNVSY